MTRRPAFPNTITCRACKLVYELASDGPPAPLTSPRERAETIPMRLGWTSYARTGARRERWEWTCPEHSPRGELGGSHSSPPPIGTEKIS